MPQGALSSLDDTIGVAVVNYRMPHLPDRQALVANAHKIRQMIEGLKLGLPGLDLVVFPEFSTYGLAPGMPPGEEVEVLAQACRNARVWGVFSSVGDGTTPAMMLMNDRGEAVPTRSCAVSDGPKGLKLSLLVCDDEQDDDAVRSAACQGAELLVRGLGRLPGAERPSAPSSRRLARVHGLYVAMASASGIDGAHDYGGRSAIIDFEGHVLAECGGEDYGVRYASLRKGLIRDARCNGTWPAALLTSASRGLRSRPAGAPPGGACPPPRP